MTSPKSMNNKAMAFGGGHKYGLSGLSFNQVDNFKSVKGISSSKMILWFFRKFFPILSHIFYSITKRFSSIYSKFILSSLYNLGKSFCKILIIVFFSLRFVIEIFYHLERYAINKELKI